MLVDIVLYVCLAVNVHACQQVTAPRPAVVYTPAECLAVSAPFAAQWLSDHPQYELKSRMCVPRKGLASRANI